VVREGRASRHEKARRDPTSVSANDIVTAALAFAAIVVSVVGYVINNTVSRRAARSSLTDLTIKVHDKAEAYRKVTDQSQKYPRAQELEVLMRQADFLMKQVGNDYPEAICIIFAQTLELIADYWWADKYWEAATHSDDPYYRAMTICYWALALMDRGQRQPARDKAEEALSGLRIDSIDAYIVRGDICRLMGKADYTDESWFRRAQKEYEHIPEEDGRHNVYLRSLMDDERQTARLRDEQAAADRRAKESKGPQPAVTTGGEQ
jgi:tetratricopeptide (TPR) repeat protein